MSSSVNEIKKAYKFSNAKTRELISENERLIEDLESMAKDATKHDRVNRSIFTQFLHNQLDTEPKNIADSITRLRKIEENLNSDKINNNLAYSSLLQSLLGYIYSNPTETSSKNIKKKMRLLFNNDDRIIDLFNKADESREQWQRENYNPITIGNVIANAIPEIIPINEITLNPNYPEYIPFRTGSLLPTIINKMNELSNEKDEMKRWIRNYEKQADNLEDSYSTAQKIYASIVNDVNDGNQKIWTITNEGPIHTLTSKDLVDLFNRQAQTDMLKIYDYYSDETKIPALKNIRDRYFREYTLNNIFSPYFEDDINKIFGNSSYKKYFINDLKRAYTNAAITIDNMTNDPTQERRLLYEYLYNMPKTPFAENYNQYLKSKKDSLSQVKMDLSNNPAVMLNSILDVGDDRFINADELVNYIANRSFSDMKNDNFHIIESVIFDPNKKKEIVEYYNKVPFEDSANLTAAIFNNDFANIDPKYYPLIYDHASKFNIPVYKQLRNAIRPAIEERIRDNISTARTFLEDQRNVVKNLYNVNNLLANLPNQYMIPFFNKINNSDLGEQELKEEISKLEGKDLTDEQKESLQKSIESLKRVKNAKEFVKNFLDTYKYDAIDRQKMFDADDELIRQYAASLEELQNVIDNANTKKWFDWSTYSTYYINEMNRIKNIEQAENLINSAKVNLNATKTAGLDTTPIEQWLDALLVAKKNDGNGGIDPNISTIALQNIIKNANTILNTQFDINSTLDDLYKRIEELPNKERQLTKEVIEQTARNQFANQFQDLYNNIQKERNQYINLEQNTANEFKKYLAEHDEKFKNYNDQQFDIMWKNMAQAIDLNNEQRTEELTKKLQSLGIDNENSKKFLNQLFNSYNDAKNEIVKQKEEMKKLLEKNTQQNTFDYTKLQNMLDNITINPDLTPLSNKIDENISAMRGMIDTYLSGNKKIITNQEANYNNLVEKLTTNSNKLAKELKQQVEDIYKIAKSGEKETSNKELLDQLNTIQNGVINFSNALNEVNENNKKWNQELSKSVNAFLSDNKQTQKEQFETLNLALQKSADKLREQQEIAKGLDGKLKEFWNEHVLNKKLISKDERYKARYDSIFKDKDKVREALLKNTISLSSEEDMKEKYFREKISQEKLKKALGFLPSDPDLKLSDVEEYLPDGFFADLKINANDKNIAPVKLKTTNYKAINNEATGNINDSLKKKLLKLYIYYKDPKQRTIKKDEYPREFLNDLAMLNINGSPTEITAKYTKYLKTGSL